MKPHHWGRHKNIFSPGIQDSAGPHHWTILLYKTLCFKGLGSQEILCLGNRPAGSLGPHFWCVRGQYSTDTWWGTTAALDHICRQRCGLESWIPKDLSQASVELHLFLTIGFQVQMVQFAPNQCNFLHDSTSQITIIFVASLAPRKQ